MKWILRRGSGLTDKRKFFITKGDNVQRGKEKAKAKSEAKNHCAVEKGSSK